MASLQYIQSSTLQTVTLGSAYTAASGTMTLMAGNGAYLPSSGDFWLAYNNGAGTIRLFKVTARSTDTLTVVAVSGEGSGDGNISSGETLRWALTYDALVQLRADIVAQGGRVLLQQQTASASATLDFTTSISSTYDDYEIRIVGLIPATNAVVLQMRVSTDGGSTYLSTNIYSHGGIRSNAGGSVAFGTNSTSQFNLGSSQGNQSDNGGFSGTVSLFAPADTARFKQIKTDAIEAATSATGYSTLSGSGTVQSAAAVNAFRFLFSSGNIASGTIRVYGLTKT